MPDSNPSDKPKPPIKFANRTRFLMLVLITLCLSIVLSNALTLNFTVICMADPMPDIEVRHNTNYKLSILDYRPQATDLIEFNQ